MTFEMSVKVSVVANVRSLDAALADQNPKHLLSAETVTF